MSALAATLLLFYRQAGWLAGPAVETWLRARLRRGREDAGRLPERLGHPSLPRPEGRLVWLHAASVGESLSVLPVVERLIRSGLAVLVTTGTTSSAALMRARLPPGALHQFVPVDRAPPVRRFLDHWRPDLAVWVESEFWPVMIEETAARDVPMVLVQGRVSDRSFSRWRRFPGLIGRLLAPFVLCLGQSARDAERLALLGARRVDFVGDLKTAAPPLPADPAELDRLRARLAGRTVWLAASTHAGEESVVGHVHQALAPRHPGLLTLVA
ncbi:MAG: 3-deoxy-D-manno-octulosonic acid transferase, partial [Alphaproteobacteria bacterium]|nr:3-deoxy-D-manno-octulosonic acid transferase [Alphaproteobacteria bacterium]